MAQVTDRTIGANPTGFDMRTELNNIIAALESDNSGSSEPLNTVPYMKWMDTSNATYYYVKERNHDNTAWVTLFRYTVATKVMEAVSNGIVLQDTAIEIHASTPKTTPIDADEIGIWDSISSTLQKLTWANLKATLKTYFDTLYVTLSGNQTIAGIKTFESSPLLPIPTLVNQAISMGNIIEKTGAVLGYGTGSGGTVTQLTSKITAVTLNKPCGQITMNNAALAAGSYTYFQLNNSLIGSGDTVVAELVAGAADPSYYEVLPFFLGSGSVRIKVKNVSGGSLSEALVINFSVIKGAIA